MARGDKKGREAKKPKQVGKTVVRSEYQLRQGEAAPAPFKIKKK